MFNLVLLLTTVFDGLAAKDATALGEAFYVPKADLVGSIPNGVNIFKDLPKECIEQRPIGKTTRNDHFYKDTSAFYKSISTSTNIDASYQSNFVMGATLDATTKDISSSERQVSGTSLKLNAKSYDRIIQANCLLQANFIDTFKKQFEALETEVTKPWQRESWRKYDEFFETYGSHVITGIVYGSSIEQYVFAESSKQYSERNFTVKACAELAGPAGAGKVDVKACFGIDDEEIKNTTSMDTSSSIVISGGSTETRNKVERDDRTPDLIEQFLNEGSSHPGPIQMMLTPVWRVLQDYYSSKEYDQMMEKTMNMEYYFGGFLNYGCYHKTAKTLDLQRFEKSSESLPGRPKFVCSIAPEGCHSPNDCHYHIGIWCNCAGDTCVRYKTEKDNTGKERTEAGINRDTWDWEGCGWKLAGSECTCTDERKERKVVWSSSQHRDPILRVKKLRDQLKKYRPAQKTRSNEKSNEEEINENN